MLTIEQASEYLASAGVSVPEFILDAFVEQANSIEECLESNYSFEAVLLIQSYLVALMALGQGDKYISSQSAPSGASQSFRYASFGDRWNGLRASIRALDPKGCADALIPPNPNQKAFAGLWVSKGTCQ